MRRPRAEGPRIPLHSGGAGAPPAGTTTRCEELADEERLGRPLRNRRHAKSLLQKRGPAPLKTPRWSAAGRAPLAKGAHAARRDAQWMRHAALHPLGTHAE